MLRVGVERAARQKESVRFEALEFGSGDVAGSINVTIRPVVDRDSGEHLFAVIFEDTNAGNQRVFRIPHATRQQYLLRGLKPRTDLKAELQASSDGSRPPTKSLLRPRRIDAMTGAAPTNETGNLEEELHPSTNLTTTYSQLTIMRRAGPGHDDLANFLTHRIRHDFFGPNLYPAVHAVGERTG